ncbi:MAG: Rieske 2Fe-2S domain-containing protein [Chloroflexi bacterium]|nr:Rieske 2Fe-2S domain-containing protein [Chloroflexota bacterium]
MADLVKICKAAEVPPGSVQEFEFRGETIMVTNQNDRYYALNTSCPHMGGKLSKGAIDGLTVTCPRHGSKFMLKTGEVAEWAPKTFAPAKLAVPPRPARAYEVAIMGDDLWLVWGND